MTHDDLAPWQDTPLVQALTAPGTDGELSGEGAALTAFQASPLARSRRRGVVRFLGTGMTSVALLGALGGGVAAAAYTKSLPDSVQSFFHDVLGPIGVPAPAVEATHTRHVAHHKHLAAKAKPSMTPVAAMPTTTVHVSTGGARRPKPGSTGTTRTVAHTTKPGGDRPKPAAGGGGVATEPTPASTPTPEATQPPPSPTPSPTPTGPAGDPSTWSLTSSLSQQTVSAGRGVQVGGTLLDAAGQPVPDHRVAIRVHLAGTTGMQQVATRRTSADGSIRYWLGNLTRNQAVVLGAGGGVHTQPARIVVLPVLTLSVAQSADGTGYVATVSANGGSAGDPVKLFKQTPNGWQNVGQSRLDGTSSVSFAIPAPKRKHRWSVRLPATKEHGQAQVVFALEPL